MLSRRQFLKKFASSLIATSCLTSVFPSLASATPKIPVLLYHRVGYTQDPLTVTPERFNNDLFLLRNNGYSTITLTQFQKFLQGIPLAIPAQPILITFDDGYIDNYDNAFKILQRHDMKATFFIISSLLWTDGRLRPNHIAEMAQAGMSFGSHTVSHRQLADLSADEVTDELRCSQATLESACGMPITTIAYPRGNYNTNTLLSVQTNGFTDGFTTQTGTCTTRTNRLELNRIPLFSYDPDILTVLNRRS